MSLNDIIKEVGSFLGYARLKEEQYTVVVKDLIGRKDVFAALPTVFGKSLCFGCLPGVFDIVMGTENPLL